MARGRANADDNATSTVYDNFGRVVQETNSQGSRYFRYNADGTLARRTDRDDRITTYSYDGLQRMTTETWYQTPGDFAGQIAYHSVVYVYDAAGQVQSVTENRISSGNPTMVAADSYAYDSFGRTVRDTQGAVGMVTVVQTSRYDANGNRTRVLATIGGAADFVNDYQYDHLGRMTDATQQSTTGNNVAEKALHFTYDLAGQFQTISRYADTDESVLRATSSYAFDSMGRLIGLTYTGESSGNALAGYHWTYDAAGRVATQYSFGDTDPDDLFLLFSDYTTWATVDYAYDATSQLLDAVYSGTFVNEPTGDADYQYDANGNRTDGGYSVATGGDNQMATGAGYQYQYDPEGNRTLRYVGDFATATDITKYTWDNHNRLTEVRTYSTRTKYDNSTPDQLVEYTYDYANRWLGEKVTTYAEATTVTQRRFAYDGNQIVLEFESTSPLPPGEGEGEGLTAGNLTRRDLWGPMVDQLFAQEAVSGQSTAGEVIWALTDNQNTVRDLAMRNFGNETTEVVNHRVLDSFGKMSSQINPQTSDPAVVDSIFGYTGRPFDENTQLQNNLNRWYEAITHRWLSTDPIGLGPDMNPYRYCGNGAVNGTDPSGLEYLRVGSGETERRTFTAPLPYNEPFSVSTPHDVINAIVNERTRPNGMDSIDGVSGNNAMGVLSNKAISTADAKKRIGRITALAKKPGVTKTLNYGFMSRHYVDVYKDNQNKEFLFSKDYYYPQGGVPYIQDETKFTGWRYRIITSLDQALNNINSSATEPMQQSRHFRLTLRNRYRRSRAPTMKCCCRAYRNGSRRGHPSGIRCGRDPTILGTRGTGRIPKVRRGRQNRWERKWSWRSCGATARSKAAVRTSRLVNTTTTLLFRPRASLVCAK